MARCQLSEDTLKGEGSRVADDLQVASLDSLAKAFANREDMKRSMQERLKVKVEAYRQEEAALTPVAPPKLEVRHTQQEGGPVARSSTAETPETNLSGASAPAGRQPGNHWIQVLLAKGGTLYAHPVTLQRKRVKVSTHYSELYDADDEEPEPESKSEENPPVQDVVELSSGS
ncbi:hypothetical protein PInf_005162 [Phytophthora infestans]|nr:hypothetical protein PInf_005162 [Phytophthora infestans]